MAHYRVVGRADCPKFAKAERIAHALDTILHDVHVEIEMIHPDKWPQVKADLCRNLGLDANKVDSPLVIDHSTGRYIGNETTLEQEADQKYGVTVSLTKRQINLLASENMTLLVKFEKEKEKEKELEQQRQQQQQQS